MDILFLVVLIVVMFGMMFWQSKKAKQQQAERQDFRSSLQPGTEVITIGGIIGKVVSVDTEYEEIVVDSDRNCVSASTPSAVNMSVRHTCMMMRSMRTAIRYPRKTSPTRSLSSTRLKSPHRMPMLFSSPLTSRRTIDFFDF